MWRWEWCARVFWQDDSPSMKTEHQINWYDVLLNVDSCDGYLGICWLFLAITTMEPVPEWTFIFQAPTQTWVTAMSPQNNTDTPRDVYMHDTQINIPSSTHDIHSCLCGHRRLWVWIGDTVGTAPVLHTRRCEKAPLSGRMGQRLWLAPYWNLPCGGFNIITITCFVLRVTLVVSNCLLGKFIYHNIIGSYGPVEIRCDNSTIILYLNLPRIHGILLLTYISVSYQILPQNSHDIWAA